MDDFTLDLKMHHVEPGPKFYLFIFKRSKLKVLRV
jgi:hypothetical protein